MNLLFPVKLDVYNEKSSKKLTVCYMDWMSTDDIHPNAILCHYWDESRTTHKQYQ